MGPGKLTSEFSTKNIQTEKKIFILKVKLQKNQIFFPLQKIILDNPVENVLQFKNLFNKNKIAVHGGN